VLTQFLPEKSQCKNKDTLLHLQEADQQQAELPTRMNDIPHHRDKRRWFYNEVTQAMLAALADGQTRMRIRQASRLKEEVLCPESTLSHILLATAM